MQLALKHTGAVMPSGLGPGLMAGHRLRRQINAAVVPQELPQGPLYVTLTCLVPPCLCRLARRR